MVLGVVSERAINKLLLGDADGCGVGFLGDSSLENSVGTEGPAGTAATLVLDGMHKSILDVINCRSRVTEHTATAVTMLAFTEAVGVSLVVDDKTGPFFEFI